VKIAVFSARQFEREYLLAAFAHRHDLVLLDTPLSPQSAPLAAGCGGVALFVNDDGSAAVLQRLHDLGVRFLLLRSAGFNHVAVPAATALGMRLARVPEYSPYAVAEHTVALMLALNRKLVRAHNRVRDLNFTLDGLVGFDMHGRTAGVLGLGKIGRIVAQILRGFGCRVLAYDPYPDEAWAAQHGVEFTDPESIFRESDLLTLHTPLTDGTRHLISGDTLATMKRGVMLINTSRGGLVDTAAVIEALKTGQIGYLGLDVYEEENGLFFEDHSEDILQDDLIARLMTFPNVLITSHQAFLTDTALRNIADTTAHNADCFERGEPCPNELR